MSKRRQGRASEDKDRKRRLAHLLRVLKEANEASAAAASAAATDAGFSEVRAGKPKFEPDDDDKERQTRAARAKAILAFVEVQRRQRESISFAELAEWYRNITGRTEQEAQEALRESVEFGDFETEDRRSRIIFRHQAVGEMPMTRSMLQNVIAIYSQAPKDRPNNTAWDQYLSHCWISATDARKWFEAQGLSPPAVLSPRSTGSATPFLLEDRAIVTDHYIEALKKLKCRGPADCAAVAEMMVLVDKNEVPSIPTAARRVAAIKFARGLSKEVTNTKIESHEKRIENKYRKFADRARKVTAS